MAELGRVVGTCVGAVVGACVRAGVGLVVGHLVGRRVGELVAVVGACVGAVVVTAAPACQNETRVSTCVLLDIVPAQIHHLPDRPDNVHDSICMNEIAGLIQHTKRRHYRWCLRGWCIAYGRCA